MARKSKAVESAAGSVEDTGYWEREFGRWLAPFLEALGHKQRRKWAPLYVRGLLGPGDRKSIEPMAERVAPDDGEQLRHVICTSCWDPAPLERTLAEKAQQMVGGRSLAWTSRPSGHGRHQGGRSVNVTVSPRNGNTITCGRIASRRRWRSVRRVDGWRWRRCSCCQALEQISNLCGQHDVPDLASPGTRA